MSRIHISEQKARKIIRSLIENLVDEIDGEDYYNIMVDEIDNHYGHILVMKDKVRESIGEFKNMMMEINESDLDNEKKELLKSKILSIFNEGDIYKI
jgi:chemotaxis protein CheY-P-specific phosphatase CheC